MYGEHIEEMYKLFKENGEKNVDNNTLAIAVAENVCDQGLEKADTDEQFDELVAKIRAQVDYMRG